MTTRRPAKKPWFNPPAGTGAGYGQTASGLLIPAAEVAKYHENDDVDKDRQAHHHTLGVGSGQALHGDYLKNLPRQQAYLYQPEPLPANATYRLIYWDYVEQTNLSTLRPHWGYNGNGGFIVPEDGYYRVDLRVLHMPLASSAYKTHVYIHMSGVQRSKADAVIFQGNYETVNTWAEWNMNKGDIVEAFVHSTTVVNAYGAALGTFDNNTYITMRKISEKW